MDNPFTPAGGNVLRAADAANTHFHRAIDHFLKTISSPDATFEDLHQADQDLWDACHDSSEEAQEGFKRAVRDRFAAFGWTEEEIEDWMDSGLENKLDKLRGIVEMSWRAHQLIPKAKPAIKHLWAMAVGGVGVAVAAFLIFAHNATTSPSPQVQQQPQQQAEDPTEEFRRRQVVDQARDDAQRSIDLADKLNHLNDTIPSDVSDQMPHAVAEMPPAIAALPQPAAVAIMAQPLTIEYEAPRYSTETKSVSQVWRDIPASHESIEQAAQQTQSDKSIFDDPNSCSRRHCLSVNVTVKSPIEDGNGGYVTAHIHSD